MAHGDNLSTYLRYTNRAENSDKVYEVHLERDGIWYRVIGKYGRHGGTLSETIKQRSTTGYALAEQAYHRTIQEKRAGGYQRVREIVEGVEVFPAVGRITSPPSRRTTTTRKRAPVKVEPKPSPVREITILDDPGFRKLTI